MSIVVVLVGQCGNQVGDELFSQLAVIQGIGSAPPPGATAAGTPKGMHANPGSGLRGGPPGHTQGTAFFTREGVARCVLIDSEPKVVQGVQKRHPHFIRADNVVYGQSGRGNNWGLGYYGVNDPHSKRNELKGAAEQRAFKNLHKGQRVQDDGLFSKALRAIHAETRRTADSDDFEAIVMIHSLSGGTGSGLASRLAERIRLYFVEPQDGEAEVDEIYEEKMRRLDGLDGMLMEKRRARYFISIPLAPMALGELSTQGINAVLTLQVLLQCTDAVLLLRNDDALSPGDTQSSSTSAGAGGAALLPKCMTYKEVNELLVGMLLPLFHYGVGPSGGAVEAIVRQVAPRGSPDTGRNILLTLLPAPQRVYERFRGVANRLRFYGLYGGKDYLPGCKPELPESVLLSPSALQRQSGEAPAAGARRGKGSTRGRKPLWKSVARRPKPVEPFSFGRDDDEDDYDDGGDGERRRDEEEDFEQMVSHTVNVQVPPALRAHYATLRRSPAASFFQHVEGVAVLNQARELSASLLLPLLKSAAFKVKVGAYMSAYQEVGVTAARIEKAYRAVAEALLDAEEAG